MTPYQSLIICLLVAIIILSVACCFLWMGLARTKANLQDVSDVSQMDCPYELIDMLSSRLPTLPDYKVKTLKYMANQQIKKEKQQLAQDSREWYDYCVHAND